MILACLYVSAYFLGSIPFAVLLGRIKGIDILKTGSGNPGMTNVWRALGPTLGITCFLLDIAKGMIPTVVARYFITAPVGPFDPQFIWFTAGVAALIGHCCSIFLRFKGGKAVSTSLGTILGTSPLVGLFCFLVFVVLFLLTGYVSLASVIGVMSVVAFNFIVPGQSHQLVPVFVLLSILIVFRHRANFGRIMDGTERKADRAKLFNKLFGKLAKKPPEGEI